MFTVKSFSSNKQKKLREVMFDIRFNNTHRSLPILEYDDFDIDFNLDGFDKVVQPKQFR